MYKVVMINGENDFETVKEKYFDNYKDAKYYFDSRNDDCVALKESHYSKWINIHFK